MEGESENTATLDGEGGYDDDSESDFESRVHNAFASKQEVMMTQPTIPLKDDKTEEEKTNLPPVAGEQDLAASKEAKDTEAEAKD